MGEGKKKKDERERLNEQGVGEIQPGFGSVFAGVTWGGSNKLVPRLGVEAGKGSGNTLTGKDLNPERYRARQKREESPE